MKKSTKISLVVLSSILLTTTSCSKKDDEWVSKTKNNPVTVHTNTNNKDSVGYYRHSHNYGINPMFWVWYGMHMSNSNSYYRTNPNGYYKTPTTYSTVSSKTKSFSTVSGKTRTTTSGPKGVTRSGFGTSFKSPSA